MAFTVYEIRHLPTGQKYIGQTGQKLPRRWSTHKSWAKAGMPGAIYDAMREYTVQEFEIRALAVVPTREYALMCEEGLIVAHNTREAGFNVSFGVGFKGCQHSPETKAKMRTARLGKPMTDEGKQRLREFRTGRKWSDEARAKASASKRGKPWSEARRQHMQDPAYREKMRAAAAKGGAAKAKRGMAQ